ncbi:hypothetical protein GUJ93_ZPchr0009g2158 [Zizania palustris]|uniref:Uncharacterized protein n=1 Tax=Zizania palustris TaxID=103762 RepID=A0A8J5V5T7_ZIZPA|nr:hypothetical protein GUJ93_ZPchr0009g2158 [Zizania palustris]
MCVTDKDRGSRGGEEEEEQAEDNLAAHTEAYLEQTVLRHPGEATKVLKSCEELLPLPTEALTMAPTRGRMRTTWAAAMKIRRSESTQQDTAKLLVAVTESIHFADQNYPTTKSPSGLGQHHILPIVAMTKRQAGWQQAQVHGGDVLVVLPLQVSVVSSSSSVAEAVCAGYLHMMSTQVLWPSVTSFTTKAISSTSTLTSVAQD